MTGVKKEPGIRAYDKNGKTFWRIDVWLEFPDGTRRRRQVSNIPSLAAAKRLRDQLRTEAFEGRYFIQPKMDTLTVEQVWKGYEPISMRDNKSWLTDKGRAAHLIEHLGDRIASKLTQRDVDEYRKMRLRKITRRGGSPAFSTLNRETELLQRMLNYAVTCRKLEVNPVVNASRLKEDNVRRITISESDFANLLECAEESLRPILIVAYDTGLRLQSILNLEWSKVRLDSERGKIVLSPQDVKANSTPIVVLTERARSALEDLPVSTSGYVFVNPKTNKPWKDIRKMFHRAKTKAELPDIWFHDQRRSFITNARHRGVDESTIMSMSGHKTRSAFDRYNIVSERDQLKAVARIEAGRKQELAQADSKAS